MSFDKTEYIDNFIHHAKVCLSSAEKHFNKSFPKELLFQIGYDENHEEALELGK